MSLYLMTGMLGITTCADIVYGKQFRTHFSHLFLFLSCSYLDARYSRTVYICYYNSDFIVA